MVTGTFSSWFKDKPSPLLEESKKDETGTTAESKDKENAKAEKPPIIGRIINHSSDSSRLIVLGSNAFVSDVALNLSSSVNGSEYLTPVQLVANAVDWSLEDRNLLGMRSRTEFSRVLLPLQNSERRLVEYFNYALAFMGLALVWLVGFFIRRREHVRYQAILDSRRIAS
jgi:ABC-2 type transport system permease protein